MAAGELYPFEDTHINTHRRINVWRYFLACRFNSLKAFALYSRAKHPRGHLITLSPLKGRLITLSNTTVHLRGQVFDLPKSLPTRPICCIIWVGVGVGPLKCCLIAQLLNYKKKLTIFTLIKRDVVI